MQRGQMEGEIDLATWISTQRSNFNKGKLDDVRIDKLNSIGMIWDVPEYKFQTALDALLAFKAREGHVQVPQKHKENGYPLGTWVSGRKLRWTQMSEEHQKRLRRVGLMPSTEK